MNNERTNEGTNNDDPHTEGAGIDGHTSSGEAKSTHKNHIVLENATDKGGVQNGEAKTDGAETTATVETYAGDPNWLFSGIWNHSLEEGGEERAYGPRDRMFATELGKAPIDVYLAMKGTKPSNLPNGRSKRKFEAGNMWEWIVGLVLKRAGIIRSSQERVELQTKGMCAVSGRLDYIAGGKVNPDTAREEIAKFELPVAFYRGFDKIVEHLQTKYPEGLKDKPLEIKSLSAYMFDAIEKGKKPLRLHVRQLMHYMLAKKFESGHIVYICRDDCRMMEFIVLNNEENRKDYDEAVALRSGYYQRDERPPLEKPILWDADTKRFTKNNIGMAYSSYLTLLYKLKDQQEFDDKYAIQQNHFNSVVKRIAKGAKMTPKNEEWLTEMREMGFDPNELAAQIPKDAPEEEETVLG